MTDKTPALTDYGLRRIILDDGRPILVDADDPHSDEQIRAFYRTVEQNR
jgi:hypothetical protein